MAKDDHAIVVGVTEYPGLVSLKGPENDACDFYDWLIDRTGGQVPKKHVRLIVTSKFRPPFASAIDARPTSEQFQREVERLFDEGERRLEATGSRRIGRRLYLFLAGHGCVPKLTEEQTALLMANATRRRTGHHLLGQYYGDLFFRGGYFDEVLLFMDCCREPIAVPSPSMPYGSVDDPDATRPEMTFYGFGAKFRRLSYEKPMANGQVHGIFTATLLRGLRGAAVVEGDPQGRITAGSLKDYLYNAMKDLLTPAEREDSDIPKEPKVVYEDAFRDSWVIAHGPPSPRYTVRIHVPPVLQGKKLKILAGSDDNIKVLVPAQIVPAVWTLQLERNMYFVQVLETHLLHWFEVTGSGEVDVVLEGGEH